LIRNTIIALVLISSTVLLVDGRVPKKACDHVLLAEWGRATVLRESDDHVIHRPTAEQASELRTAIQICKHFTSEFDLTSNIIGEGEAWGTASILNLAVELDDVSFLDQLASEGHSVDGLPNTLNISTLYMATHREATNAFYWALENKVDPDLADIDGISPLMIAATRPQDSFPSLKELLNANASIDAADWEGRTALVYAIRSENYDNARWLVDAGADINVAKQGLIHELYNAPSQTYAERVTEALRFLEGELNNGWPE